MFEEYQHPLPSYVQDITSSGATTTREFFPSDDKVVFQERNKRDNKYSAYNDDIAVVHFYFEEAVVMEFSRDPRLTWIGFFSEFYFL